MIKKKILSLDNALLLMKRIGYCKVLKMFWSGKFVESSLCSDLESMIICEEKNEKEESERGANIKERNEKLLADLCECYLMVNNLFSIELLSICVPCLLKVALKKEESQETSEEVEMALLALSNIEYCEIRRKLYLNEIKAIIRYHQEHHNLTRLAYQSAWQFLINEPYFEKEFEDWITNDLHFVKEATRELDELMKCVDWKKTEKELNKSKEVQIIWKYLKTAWKYFSKCQACCERIQFNEFAEGVVKLFKAAKECERSLQTECAFLLMQMTLGKAEKIDIFVRSGAAGCIVEEMWQQTLGDRSIVICIAAFEALSERLSKKTDNTFKKAKWKMIKREIFDKFEEEGYEDIITSFQEMKSALKERCWFGRSENLSGYLIHI
eukprot:MONOS_1720.1-p1 / transcript=MONOS_1720.1 / gene=MONOS_1720 / organism=Monocercomonoides_exilis_PA203 / gene_product=unspecified product / transcript_product=unspecified product / location=Mono_scaffold00032:15633-16840(-) / protein_length=382 / sequence_SO=supercontig / SO=protein_coding / is_pseudo=false